MPVGQLQFFSRALQRETIFSFCVPDAAGSGPYPAILQLHGAGDTHTSWLLRSRLANFVQRIPLVVIMPDGARSNWANWRLRGPGMAYEDFLMEDLLTACEAI